jgi:hypothetical protein
VRAITYFLIKEDCMTNLFYRNIFFPHKCMTREKAVRMEVLDFRIRKINNCANTKS